MYEYFVKGMPAVMTCNVKPALGLANGCRCKYEQLIMPPSCSSNDKAMLELRISTAQPGEFVDLDFTPHLIMIEIPIDVHEEQFPAAWAAAFPQHGKSVLVPIDLTSFPTYASDSEAIHIHGDPIHNIRNGSLGHTMFRVEPFLASTILKIQGLTLSKYVSVYCAKPTTPFTLVLIYL